MNRAARAMIQRIREHGYRVLFMCNYDGTVSVTAIGASREAYILHGKLSDDSRLITELAKILNVTDATGPRAIRH